MLCYSCDVISPTRIYRAAFENEFKAFSLEQEKRAARSAAPAPEDPASTKHETPPQQQ